MLKSEDNVVDNSLTTGSGGASGSESNSGLRTDNDGDVGRTVMTTTYPNSDMRVVTLSALGSAVFVQGENLGIGVGLSETSRMRLHESADMGAVFPQHTSPSESALSDSSIGAERVASTVDGQQQRNNNGPHLDFIGSSATVKNLFALPYASTDVGVSVALHNLGEGTLLLDGGVDHTFPSPNEDSHPPMKHREPSFFRGSHERGARAQDVLPEAAQHEEEAVYDAVETDIDSENNKTSSSSQALALSAVSSVLRNANANPRSTSLPLPNFATAAAAAGSSWFFAGKGHENEAPTRQYLSWQFHDMRLLVASDALIYQPPQQAQGQSQAQAQAQAQAQPQPSEGRNDGDNAQHPVTSQALTVRVENVLDLQSQLQKHETMVREKRKKVSKCCENSVGSFPSYADVVASSSLQHPHAIHSGADVVTSAPSSAELQQERLAERHPDWSFTGGLGHNLKQMQLQTCVLPNDSASPSSHGPTDSTAAASQFATSSSPVFTCLDAYLDNIMANVPQLALCLEEKGFIQSVKLLKTEDIPTSMIHSSTLSVDTSNYVSRVFPTNGGTDAGDGKAGPASSVDPIFSPAVVDLNATMLLRFLKDNCSSENTTYLLRREPGRRDIQLYDVTSISSRRLQRKWTWWLAMMSYRFALRLQQHGRAVEAYAHPALSRSFRDRQRSLLRTSLDLLEELADMDGGRHETICAAVNERLADTFLASGPQVTEEGTPGGTSCATIGQPTTSSSQPYGDVTVDGLNKAQDFLLQAIRMLVPLLERAREELSATVESLTFGKPRASRRRRKRSSVPDESIVSVPEAISQMKKEDEQQHAWKGKGERSGVSEAHVGKASVEASHPQQNIPHFHTEASAEGIALEVEALSLQLYSLHHKLVNVSLRLAQHHFRKYWSSSAVQALRMSARRLADSIALLTALGYIREKKESAKSGKNSLRYNARSEVSTSAHSLIANVQYQFAWLWEYCGHFARSFAADSLWRERGHTCGDDVVSLLREVEAACNSWGGSTLTDMIGICELTVKTKEHVTLQSLSALFYEEKLPHLCPVSKMKTPLCNERDLSVLATQSAVALLDNQPPLKKDKLRVLVAASICYSRAIGTFRHLARESAVLNGGATQLNENDGRSHSFPSGGKKAEFFLGACNLLLLQKRFGDACNEIGKILLSLVRDTLSSLSRENKASASPLLRSAEFWFKEGLEHFVQCKDLCNIALLRCNLCQCSKMKANSHVATVDGADPSTNAEVCLQAAADHLLLAHGAMVQRDENPRTWDMVSEELAATFLVLGVRRRQNLLGGGTVPVVAQAQRLSRGQERSVVHPMEQALGIYENLCNAHQAAAAHYQLALFYTKVWTCQRDEQKTREKLSAAFKHYSEAHNYFSSSMRGNEPTFVILSLDLSNLYSSVAGNEGVTKAFSCCVNTYDAFSAEAVAAAIERKNKGSVADNDWLDKMTTLAETMEERLFKLLLSLVKIEKETGEGKLTSEVSDSVTYKDLYRTALKSQMERNGKKHMYSSNDGKLLHVHRLLGIMRCQHDSKS